jgi:putative ABC transport system permease protein
MIARNGTAMLWRPVDNLVRDNDLLALRYRHSEMGFSVETLPWLDHAMARLEGKNGVGDFEITAYSQSPLSERAALDESSGRPEICLPVVWLAADQQALVGPGRLLFQGLRQQIAMSVEIRLSTDISPGFIGLDKNLAGRLNVARRQSVEHDPANGTFYFADRRWRFFRAYAQDIAHLEPLVNFLTKTGRQYGLLALTENSSKIGEVRRFWRLSSYMSQLYALIVAITGVSAFFAISANVYAGIQRKKYDLAYLRLMGMSRATVVLFPYLKSLVLVSLGMFLAWAFYLFFNTAASRILFAGQARLAHITPADILLVAAGVWGVASIASLVASLRVYRIDPAESLRD